MLLLSQTGTELGSWTKRVLMSRQKTCRLIVGARYLSIIQREMGCDLVSRCLFKVVEITPESLPQIPDKVVADLSRLDGILFKRDTFRHGLFAESHRYNPDDIINIVSSVVQVDSDQAGPKTNWNRVARRMHRNIYDKRMNLTHDLTCVGNNVNKWGSKRLKFIMEEGEITFIQLRRRTSYRYHYPTLTTAQKVEIASSYPKTSWDNLITSVLAAKDVLPSWVT